MFYQKKNDIFPIRIGRIRCGVSHPRAMAVLALAPASS
jgi:hypothetical protein